MKNLAKKGQVMEQLGGLGVGVATITILLAVTFLVLAETGEQTAIQAGIANGSLRDCYSAACNSTSDLTAATATIPDWVPLIILIGIGGIILAMVVVFGGRK